MITTEKLPDEPNKRGLTVEVEWDVQEKYDDAGDGHCFFHFATGWSENELHRFEGTAILVDGELDHIEDITYANG